MDSEYVNPNTNSGTMKEIDKTIAKYESRVSEFESEMAPKEEDTTSSDDVYLSTVVSDINSGNI